MDDKLLLLQMGVITLFPEMFDAISEYGVTGRAIKRGLIALESWNPRDFTHDRHHTVDDRPYGGGPGMLMMVQPLKDAIEAAKEVLGSQAKVIYLSPQGKPFNQAGAVELAKSEKLIFLAGRYEGIDERLIRSHVDEEWSVGDYVLSGGELPAMTMIDAVSRLVPGVLGDKASAEQDSFMNGLLDYPHYTRPHELDGEVVPSVLLSGNHQEIARWREKQSLGRTYQRRPELLKLLALTDKQQALLAEYIRENNE
ncbi:MAG: tRNA (guanine-N(1)-)-methyltransferase [Candidatus Celerinatantimonas neptuna]|nr:MAG: tRNA (guanine-N(1)-)-methyltransferase [Candidatus Celerinatantimonas neptuna]